MGLAGFVLCVVVMFLIQPVYAVIAWAMCHVLLYYIVRSNVSLDWGSSLTGLRFHVAIRSLLSIDMQTHLDQNWKPQLLLLYTLREVEQHEALAAVYNGNEPPSRARAASRGGKTPTALVANASKQQQQQSQPPGSL